MKTLDPELKVRARPGYFAPKPPPVRPTIEFTLTDTNPTPHDMTIDELQVVEDGVPQKLEAFQEASTPVSIVFALDASGSMKKATEPLKAAARSFVEQVRPEDSLATLLFSDKVRFEHDLTTRRDWSLDAINHYVANGGTALYDAVYDSLSRLKGIEGRRMVIVMTDGRDENNPGTAPGSVHSFAEVLDHLKKVDAVVFTVGLGPKIDRPVLEQLAAVSGGEAYFPEDVSVLAHRLQPDSRDAPPPIRHQLHLDELDARRRLAQGGDHERPRRHLRREPRRLLRARQMTRRAATASRATRTGPDAPVDRGPARDGHRPPAAVGEGVVRCPAVRRLRQVLVRHVRLVVSTARRSMR